MEKCNAQTFSSIRASALLCAMRAIASSKGNLQSEYAATGEFGLEVKHIALVSIHGL